MSKLNFFLIEDDPAQIRLVSHYLKLNDIGVTTTSAYQDAIKMTETISPIPDLIILDLQIQGGDGIDLISFFKKSRLGEVPIVILSAYSSSEKIERSLSEGARDYIIKPINPPEFLERILTYV